MNIGLLLRNSTTMAMALASPASASSSSSPSSSSAGNGQQEKKYVQEYLTHCKSFYSCIHCRTHLANHDELVSRSFQGNHGRAYLFNSVINISCGPAMQRELNTGAHAVADIFCSNCDTILGWKYEKAYVKTQKYKEGKYIIELAHVVRENRHLEMDKRDLYLQSQNILNNSGRHGRPVSHSITSTTAATTNRSPSSSVDSAIAVSPSSSLFSSSPRSTTSSSPSSPPASASFSSAAAARPQLESNLNASIQSDNINRASNASYSSNASIRDAIDDDLMFPYYDDLCLEDEGRVSGSFVGSFSSACLHNRIRRSLYLDSKPYDWKYSTRSISDRAADRTKQPDAEEEQAARAEQQEQQRDNNDYPKLSWQHQDQTIESPSAGSSQHQQSINFSSQSMADKRQRVEDEDDDDLDSGNSCPTDEQVRSSSSDTSSDESVMAQRDHWQQLKRNQVDESEIQFNFEADNIIVADQQHTNYGQQEQQNHQNATAMSNNSHVERRQQFAQQNNNKPTCDQQQQQQQQLASTRDDKFESNVQAGDFALTSSGNNSNDNDNNNNDNDNDNNTIRQPVGSNSNLVAMSNQKSDLENKSPKLDDQSSTTTTAATGMSSSFSFDDEEFYDCYTS